VTAIFQQKDIDYYDVIAHSIKASLNARARDGGFFDIPEASYNSLRKQYNPESIMNMISDFSDDGGELALGVVHVDIYARGLNFVFGLANPLRRIALVSTYRLSGPKLEERLAKEVVHETGHLLGLNHCEDAQCVMFFSNTVEDTDNKGKMLCEICRSKYET
jgi:archaemetzincin